MTIMEKRQLLASMALAMKDLSEDEKSGKIVKTENGYDWIADNGEVIISMRV